MAGMGKTLIIAMFAATAPAAVAAGGSPLKSSAAAVQIRATVQERLSLVSATQRVGFGSQASQLEPGDRPISFTTSWNLEATRTAVVVSAFFEDANGALTVLPATNADRIATSDVWGRDARGTNPSFRPFSSSVRWAGSGMEVFRQQLRPHVNDMASRTDDLELQVDLRHRASPRPAGYVGVLTLVAEAY